MNVEGPLPASAGIGFKPMHLEALLADPQAPAFVEVHAENYMGAGGAPHAWLGRVRERMPLSIHGVGLSLGAEAAPDEAHLDRLARLIERYEPASFSEHLAWSSHGVNYFNDLLPVAYERATLDRVCAHIDRVQTRLGRRMLLENPATYVEFESSTMSEQEFISTVIARTGCGLLLDVNNVFVSCSNHGRDATAFLEALPLHAVGEIHLAGHSLDHDGVAGLLIDSHGSAVADPVWSLYGSVIARIGPAPTLVEWDNDVPAYEVLRAEAVRAQAALSARPATSAPVA